MDKNQVNKLYQTKVLNFQNAIHAFEEFRGLERYNSQDGYNDYDDRYWSCVLHRQNPDLSLNKESRLSYGFGESEYSIIFIYDHETGKTLFIQGNFDPKDEKSYLNYCQFAQYYSQQNILVAQFVNRLVMYQLDSDFRVTKIIDSHKSLEYIDRYFSKGFKKVVFEKSGLNYLVIVDSNGDPSLIHFDMENENILTYDSLPGYMTSFGSVDTLYIKELGLYPIVVMGIHGKQKSDPDPGYSVFIQNGKPEKGFNLWNFKNAFFQSWSPNKFVFGEWFGGEGYIEISVFADELLLEKVTLPTNMNFKREKKG